MIELAIVGLVVAACTLYWVKRLFPSSVPLFWRTTARVLRQCRAPRSLQLAVGRHAFALPTRFGCGSCNKCDGGGCH